MNWRVTTITTITDTYTMINNNERERKVSNNGWLNCHWGTP